MGIFGKFEFFTGNKILKLSVSELNKVHDFFFDWEGVVVDSRGRSGGLVLWWKKGVIINIFFFFLYYIDFFLDFGRAGLLWRFTGIYGWPEASMKRFTGDLFRDFGGYFFLPWFCMGDFNEILFNDEKSGGIVRN